MVLKVCLKHPLRALRACSALFAFSFPVTPAQAGIQGPPTPIVPTVSEPQTRRATISISTSAPTANPVTPIVVRAGNLPG